MENRLFFQRSVEVQQPGPLCTIHTCRFMGREREGEMEGEKESESETQ